MKKLILMCSHPNSGSGGLYEALTANPRVQGCRSQRGNVYETGTDLLRAVAVPHKVGNSAGVYLDELLRNPQVATKTVYSECRFIYVVRQPAPVLGHLRGLGMDPEGACRSYLFRLRRLCEMAKRTPGAVLLTWDDLEAGRGMDLLEEFMNLKQPVEFSVDLLQPYSAAFTRDEVPHATLRAAEEGFERYLYFLRSQSLRTPG